MWFTRVPASRYKLNILLSMCSQRNLSIKEKITILKARDLLIITYVCNFIFVCRDFIIAIDKILYKFVWKNKHYVNSHEHVFCLHNAPTPRVHQKCNNNIHTCHKQDSWLNEVHIVNPFHLCVPCNQQQEVFNTSYCVHFIAN